MQSDKARRCARHCEEVERGELLRADAIPKWDERHGNGFERTSAIYPNLIASTSSTRKEKGGEIVSVSVPRCADEQPRTTTLFSSEAAQLREGGVPR